MGSFEVRGGREGRAREAKLTLENLESRILLSSVSWTIEDAQAVTFQAESHRVTEQELADLQDLMGVNTAGTTSNVLVDGHGTGLRAPTADEWQDLAEELEVVDNYQPLGQAPQIPTSVDWSQSQYFPPIGTQDGEGSCTSWAHTYYMKTFQEAQEHGWNLSGASWEGGYKGHPTPEYQDMIFSPDFTYHQINGGRDRGSWVGDAQEVCKDIGVATWSTMPFDPDDSSSWPAEEAWREAPVYRGSGSIKFMSVSSSVDSLRNYLADGHLAEMNIDASDMHEMSTLDNFFNQSINHAQTVVGYDDDMTYTEAGEQRQGAFKIANSWGPNWSANNDGCWWISYEALKQRVGGVWYFEDRVDYNPEMVAVADLDHPVRGDTEVNFGVGDPHSPTDVKTFRTPGWSSDGDDPYPDGKIVLDITELNYDLQSNPSFFVKVGDSGTANTGTISTYSVEYYSDYINGAMDMQAVSDDTPVDTIEGGDVVAEAVFAWCDIELMQSSDTGMSSTDLITADNTPTYAVTVNGPGEVEIDWENDGTVDLTQTVPFQGWHLFAPQDPLADGTVTTAVTFTSQSQAEDTAQATITVDTVAPAAPGSPDLQAGSDSGMSDTDNITNVLSPSFDIPSVPGPGYYRFYRDSTQLSGDYATASSFTVQNEVEGTWDYALSAVDVAGNESSLSSPLPVAIDRGVQWMPEMLVLKESSDTGVSSSDRITKDVTPAYDIPVDEAGVIRIDWDGDGTVDRTESVGQGGTYSYAPLSALSEGPNAVKVSFQDLAGNAADEDVPTVIDTQAPGDPSAPDLQAGSDSGMRDDDDITNAGDLTFDVASTDAFFRFYRDGSRVSGEYESGSTYELTGEPEGVWDYSVVAVDRAGNQTSPSPDLTVEIDRTAPITPAPPDLQAGSDSGIENDDNITNATDLAFNVSAAGSYFRFFRGGVQVSGDYELGFTYTVSSQSEGMWNYNVAAVDAAGNASAPSGSAEVTIDTTAPAAPQAPDLQAASDTGVPDNNVTADKSPVFDVTTGSSGDYFRLYRDGQLVSQAPVVGDDGRVYRQTGSEQLPAQPVGRFEFAATQVDAAGNESSHSQALDVCITDLWPVAWHEYEDGVTVTIYDVDAAGGADVTEPEIAWNRGEYQQWTDILVAPGTIGDGNIETVLLDDGRGGLEDIGIAVEGNGRIGRVVDRRPSPVPMGFFASQGPVGLLQLGAGTEGGRLNNAITEGGWSLPEDIDDDGATDDLTGVYSPGGVTSLVSGGDLDGDTVLGGDLRNLRITDGDLNGDLVLTGSTIGRAIVMGNIAGDIDTPGNIGVVYSSGGDMTGSLRAGGSVRMVKAVDGDVSFGEIRTGGYVRKVIAEGGDVNTALQTGQGNIGTVLARADEQTGRGGTITGSISAGWDVGSVLAVDGHGIEAGIRANGRIGQIFSRGGDIDLSDGSRCVLASFGIGKMRVVDGDIVGDGKTWSDEIKVWGGNLGLLQASGGNIMGVGADVAGMARSGCIGTVAALEADQGIVNSTFKVESRLETVRVTCKSGSGGNMHNTSIEATRLGRVMVAGRISEDAANSRTDHICADLGSYVASDNTWTGWVDQNKPHWFDEGSPSGLQAFAV